MSKDYRAVFVVDEESVEAETKGERRPIKVKPGRKVEVARPLQGDGLQGKRNLSLKKREKSAFDGGNQNLLAEING